MKNYNPHALLLYLPVPASALSFPPTLSSRVRVNVLELWIQVDFGGCEQREGFHFLSPFLIGGIKPLPTNFQIENRDYTNVYMNDFP